MESCENEIKNRTFFDSLCLSAEDFETKELTDKGTHTVIPTIKDLLLELSYTTITRKNNQKNLLILKSK